MPALKTEAKISPLIALLLINFPLTLLKILFFRTYIMPGICIILSEAPTQSLSLKIAIIALLTLFLSSI